MSEENDSLDLEQHILRRMSNEYLLVWHHFCPLVVLNGQQIKISVVITRKESSFCFLRRCPSLDITALRLRDIFRIRFIIRRLVAFLSFCRLSVLCGDCFAFARLPKQRRPGWILKIIVIIIIILIIIIIIFLLLLLLLSLLPNSAALAGS